MANTIPPAPRQIDTMQAEKINLYFERLANFDWWDRAQINTTSPQTTSVAPSATPCKSNETKDMN